MSGERTFEFTDRKLKGLPVPPKPEQRDYFDTKARGLGLRVSYGGRKSFFLMYSANGKRQRVSPERPVFGRLEEGNLSLAAARKWATAKLGEVAKDRDPAAERRAGRKAPTVETLAADFIAHQRRQGRKSADAQERMLARNVLPELGSMKARDVSRADIRRIMEAMTDRGAPIQANRVHEVVRAMFSFGTEEEDYGFENNPAATLRKRRNPEPGRDRWLKTEELGRYWNALDDSPGATALKLALLCAQRGHNVREMRVGQLSLEDRFWIVSGSETKTDATHQVPLSGMAVRIIKDRIAELEKAERRRAKRQRREARAVDWLFPKERGGDGPACYTIMSKAHARACEKAKIEDYKPHDGLHTYGTHCDMMGIPPGISDGIRGHAESSMGAHYSHYDFAKERLDCMERWANRIRAATSDNVVSIEREKKPA